MPYVIAIAGLSGSGKTTLAREVARRLDGAVIELDSYYLPQPGVPVEERARRNYDHPDAIDWPLLRSHVDSFLRGESVEVPVYLFDEHTRGPSTRRLEHRQVCVLEGILALHEEIRGMARLRAFVSTEADVCLRRRIERDVVERGRTRESVIEQYNSTVWPMALQHVLPTTDHADVVVSGEASLDEAVRAIVARARRQMPR